MSVFRALRPPALDELGLLAALREQAARQGQGELRVTVDGPGQLPPLPAAVEVAAYHIVREALTNVTRHAGARHCAISLRLGDGLDIAVVDDGCGVAGARPGVGATSMRERAEEVGGACAIDTRPGGGTRVQARLPLDLSALNERGAPRASAPNGSAGWAGR